ncbi:hypothetical protein I316_00908 [Kwoniella heveanensis BCC8398]|uniref:ASTRA-associated protein 1 n=1 Tax=Kwoniella heveanensis BCC8398 TaxID=1296120 RepID=A0A1B9H183_9TREE|nr:hypothetical protein I316_00908 [Kwoniella heveanensis BCC8398]
MAPPSPSPFHHLRTHHHPLSALHFNSSNTLLYSGDQDGWISILDLRVRRVICYWKAHEGGVLGLEEWEGGLISHGRDNVVHFYEPLKRPYTFFSVGASSTSSTKFGSGSNIGTARYQTGPPILRSLPTNALNFCRFSLLPLTRSVISSNSAGKEREALLAVPSLTDSELVDIYHLPSLKRIHAAINYVPNIQAPVRDSVVPESGRSGLIMSLHLRNHPSTSSIALAIGYEEGRVELYRSSLDDLSALHAYDARVSSGPNPWQMIWKGKGHNEAVMGMDVDQQTRYGWSVSADHRLVRYDFGKALEETGKLNDESVMRHMSLKQIGNSCVTVRLDGKVVAVGGWDGKIRLFSAQSCKPLGTLSSHRETVHVVTFANPSSATMPTDKPRARGEEANEIKTEAETETETETEIASTLDLADQDTDEESSDDNDEDDDAGGKGGGGVPRERWFASGGKDTKVALWGLMDFGGGATVDSTGTRQSNSQAC